MLDTLRRMGKDVDEKYLYTHTLKQMGIDSLDVMEIILEVEGIVGYQIPNSDIHDIYAVPDIYRIFLKNER